MIQFGTPNTGKTCAMPWASAQPATTYATQLYKRCVALARRRKSSDSPWDFVPHGTFKRCTLQGNRVDSPGKRSACPITSAHGFRIISSVRFVRFRTKAVGNRDGHGLDPTPGQ